MIRGWLRVVRLLVIRAEGQASDYRTLPELFAQAVHCLLGLGRTAINQIGQLRSVCGTER